MYYQLAKTPEPWNYRPMVYLGTILISIFFLGLGYFAKPIADNAKSSHFWEITSHLLNEVGIAGLIAMVLVFTIDRVTRKESVELAEFHQQKLKDIAEKNEESIKTNVFHYVFAQSLPNDIIAEIRDQLLCHNFVRHDLHVHYKINQFDDPKYVLV